MPPINPASLKPVEVTRLLNATPMGFVLSQPRIYREFNRVGFRIAAVDNNRNINLFKYLAWLADVKNTPDSPNGPRSYDERREAERARQAE